MRSHLFSYVAVLLALTSGVQTMSPPDGENVSSLIPASMALVVLLTWWHTWWAYGLYVVLFFAMMALGASFYRRRVKRREREKAKERELEHAREFEIMNEELRAHEAQLESQNALLEHQKNQLERLDAEKSRFFANISHEFRTPLTILLGPLRDLMAGSIELADLGRQVPMMHRNTERLLGLINQLLDLSRLEAGGLSLDLRRGDLASFLRAVTLSFTGLAEREEVALSFSARPKEIPAAFDPDKVEKVLTNLLSNALKFTPSGGKVSVTVGEVEEEAEIRVRDTGPGIPEEELSHIFDQFYQVDGSIRRRHGGTGIGLALVKELVELHGGSIEVESEMGFGTSFAFRLPLGLEAQETEGGSGPTSEADRREFGEEDLVFAPYLQSKEPSTIASAGPEEARATSSGAPTILVVEDNPDMRSYLKRHLESRYRVVEARDGKEGLERARSSDPALVVADVMMPEMDGYELCRQLKADPDLSDVPVVLLTAKADLSSRLEGLKTGADDYLAKPFGAEELLTRMENLIEIRRHLRERYTDTVRLGPEEVDVPSQEAAFLKEVRTVAEAHLGNGRFGVSDLAAEVGISQRQLLRRMREAVNMSPAAYLRMMRLERAAQLLEQDAGLVSEIAYEVGFKNADHFSRLFKQVFGVPPSEYEADRPG